MKKIFTLMAAAALTLTASATTFTFQNETSMVQTKDGITVTLSQGSGNNAPAYYSNGMRLYANNTITVSGGDLSNIAISCAKQGDKGYASMTASTGKLTSGGESTSGSNIVTDTWTGTAQSVTFTLGTGQRLIVQVVVNGDGSEIPGTGENPGGGDDQPDAPVVGLDPDFTYPEPTVILPPNRSVSGEPYSFIENNIQVACDMGRIENGSTDYFSAHAGYSMTFTATQNIKGIVINGMVKANFEATVDHGNVKFLTPTSDTDADPVVVITDIDSKSVTISCVKQLRCYQVDVYFDENPDATIGGGNGGGNGGGTVPGGTNLTYDTAEAIYFTSIYEDYDLHNYTIFLCNWESYDWPYFALDIYPDEKDITGTFSWDDYTLGDYTYYQYGESEDDITWCEGGNVKITKAGDIYTITGAIECEDGKTYNISFVGEVDFYTEDDYYGDGGDDGGDDDGGDENGVDSIEADGSDAPAYDLQGRRVGKGYRGVIIRSGKKSIQN